MKKLLIWFLLFPVFGFGQVTRGPQMASVSNLPGTLGQLTPGSVCIVDANGNIWQNPVNISWDDTTNTLSVKNVTVTGTCIGCGGGGGATTALDNLAAVNINTSLLSQTGVDAGSASKPFRNFYLFGSGTYSTTSIELTGTPTGARVWAFPDSTDTVVGKATTDILTHKTYDTAGTGNAFSINSNSITGVEGNTAKVQLFSGSNPATNDCASFDVNHNLQTAGAACGVAGGAPANLQIFNLANSGNNWTLPGSGQIIAVLACAGGGGGGGGSGAAAGSVRAGGGGGGGGFCTQKVFRAADITSPVTITVGAGGSLGAGGSSGTGGDGGGGGSSSFGSYLTVFGGGGGAGFATGASGGGGAGCFSAGANATVAAGVKGGDCFLVSAANTSFADSEGAGSSSATTTGAAGKGSFGGGGSGASSTTAGGVLNAGFFGGTSFYSGAGGGEGGGVNAASPGTPENGLEGGLSGPTVTAVSGGGAAGGATASACGSGGEGTAGTPATANAVYPGGRGGGGGASKAGATGCVGGNGGVGGGGGGGGGGGTSVGGDGGTGGNGYVMIWTFF